MKDVRQKVFLDLLSSPGTLVPVVGGISLVITAVASGTGLLALLGVAGIAAGVCVLLGRSFFGVEELTARAYESLIKRRQAQQIAELQELDRRLQSDRDSRTHFLLRQLWHLYNSLESEIKEGKITIVEHDVMDSVNHMFRICVSHLDRSFQLWETAYRVGGNARRQALQLREELINEVHRSVELLENTVDELHTTAARHDRDELARLHKKLDKTISVAHHAEQSATDFK